MEDATNLGGIEGRGERLLGGSREVMTPSRGSGSKRVEMAKGVLLEWRHRNWLGTWTLLHSRTCNAVQSPHHAQVVEEVTSCVRF